MGLCVNIVTEMDEDAMFTELHAMLHRLRLRYDVMFERFGLYTFPLQITYQIPAKFTHIISCQSGFLKTAFGGTQPHGDFEQRFLYYTV
jgi:hypothetical protein